jgi:hypothetical protein
LSGYELAPRGYRDVQMPRASTPSMHTTKRYVGKTKCQPGITNTSKIDDGYQRWCPPWRKKSRRRVVASDAAGPLRQGRAIRRRTRIIHTSRAWASWSTPAVDGPASHPEKSRCGHFIGMPDESTHHMRGPREFIEIIHIVRSVHGIAIRTKEQCGLHRNGSRCLQHKVHCLKVSRYAMECCVLPAGSVPCHGNLRKNGRRGHLHGIADR